MISSKVHYNLSRIIPFGVIWLVSSLVYTLIERGILGELSHYPATGNPYNFKSNLFITLTTATIAGLLIGSAEVLYLNHRFVKRSFSQKIFGKMFIYFMIILLFLFGISVVTNAVQLNSAIFEWRVWMNASRFLSSFSFWGLSIFVSYGIIVSLFFDEVSGNLGQGAMNNFLRGKYHHPMQEDRIFMFVDMKSSTTLAEGMGHVKYFEMLKEYFANLTEPIINYGGEIYQYVGDEIIVTWKVNDGIKENNCIECFFSMKRHLKSLENKYVHKFGVLPDFKAGLHTGKVTTGEIGVIKKDIIFTGDVLNTTSRIQSLCNEYNLDLLISKQLISLLNVTQKSQKVGEAILKGRNEPMILFTLFPT